MAETLSPNPTMPTDQLIAHVLDDRFRVQKYFGVGGMSRIYLAQDLETDATVILKIMKDELASDRVAKGRFLREVNSARSLKHRNIVQTLGAGEVQGRLYMAMEFMDQGNFASLLKRVRFLPWPLAVFAMFEMCSGLRYSHQQEIIHRDMKPENVLLNSEGVPKIADFGIAKTAASTQMTQDGEVLGTPAYMSPEQIAGRKMDHRTDIFSCGVIFYELLTGVNPFRESNISQTAIKVLNFRPPNIRDVDPLIPEKLSELVAQMLEKDPDRRPASFFEIGGTMQNLLLHAPVSIDQARFRQFVDDPYKLHASVSNFLVKTTVTELLESRAHKSCNARHDAALFAARLTRMLHYAPENEQLKGYLERFLARWKVRLRTISDETTKNALEAYQANPTVERLGALIQRLERSGATLELIHFLGRMLRERPGDSYLQEKLDYHRDRLEKLVENFLNPKADEDPDQTRMLSRESLSSEEIRPTRPDRELSKDSEESLQVGLPPSKPSRLGWVVAAMLALVCTGLGGYIALEESQGQGFRPATRSIFQDQQTTAAGVKRSAGGLVTDDLAMEMAVALNRSDDSDVLRNLAASPRGAVAKQVYLLAVWEAGSRGDWSAFERALTELAGLFPEEKALCALVQGLESGDNPQKVRDLAFDLFALHDEF